MDIQVTQDLTPYNIFGYFNESGDFTSALTFNLTHNFTTTKSRIRNICQNIQVAFSVVTLLVPHSSITCQ